MSFCVSFMFFIVFLFAESKEVSNFIDKNFILWMSINFFIMFITIAFDIFSIKYKSKKRTFYY